MGLSAEQGADMSKEIVDPREVGQRSGLGVKPASDHYLAITPVIRPEPSLVESQWMGFKYYRQN